MNEYEKIFSDITWRKLKKRIKGKIFVGIRDDVLKVSVKCDDMHFEMIVEDAARKIVTGELYCDNFVRVFESGYRRHVRLKTEQRLFYN